MLPCSGGRRRDQSSGHPSCISAVLLEGPLSSLSGTDARTCTKVELCFCRTAVGVVQVHRGRRLFGSLCLFAVPPLSCHQALQRNPCRPARVLSAARLFPFFSPCWFPTACTLHVYGRRNALVFAGQLCFGPQGPPAALWLCSLASFTAFTAS